ncbi:hypothetical protein [Ekhidna sp.]
MINKELVIILLLSAVLISCDGDSLSPIGEGSFTVFSDGASTTYTSNFGFFSEGELIYLNSENSPATGNLKGIDAVGLFGPFSNSDGVIPGEYNVGYAEVYIFSGTTDVTLIGNGTAEISKGKRFLEIEYKLNMRNGDTVVGSYTGNFQQIGN